MLYNSKETMATGLETKTYARGGVTSSSSCDDSDDVKSATSGRQLSKRIPRDQWESKRDIIAKLYLEEDRPLKEVMEILAREHDFRPTVKMCKSRIGQWGLDKKLKSDEVLAILRLRGERENLGKRTEYTIRGFPVDLNNIDRYVKRNPPVMARYRAGDLPSLQSTLDVRCHTPEPPSPPPAPFVTGQVEEIVSLFGEYVSGSLSDGLWVSDYNVSCKNQKSNDRVDELFERLISSFALINRCVASDDLNANAMAAPALQSFDEIIADQSPTFAIRTILLLWFLEIYGEGGLSVVLRWVNDVAPIKLGPNHLMTRIWALLITVPHGSFCQLADRLYTMLAMLLEDRIGPANYLTTVLYGDHIDCLASQGLSRQALSIATQYRGKLDAIGMRQPWHLELIITQTSLMCETMESDGQREKVFDCLHSLKSYPMSEEQEAGICVKLGNYQYRAGNISAALRSYRQAIRVLATVDGGERVLVAVLSNLERALIKKGRDYDAKTVREYRLTRIDEFAKDMSKFVNPLPSTGQSNLVAIPLPGLKRLYNTELPECLWFDEDEEEDVSDKSVSNDFTQTPHPLVIAVTQAPL